MNTADQILNGLLVIGIAMLTGTFIGWLACEVARWVGVGI